MVKIIDWAVLDPTILRLHMEGKSPNYIAKQISLQRETVVKHMEGSLGIETKRNGPRKSADWVDPEHIRCSECSEVKPASDFYKIRKDSGFHYSFCKSCNGKKERTRYLSQDITWKKKCYDLRNSAVKRSIPFGLTEDYLRYLFEKQEGLCAYTGVRLDLSTGRGLAPDCVSVDRFDTSIGYVVGNALLCSSRSNTIKHNQTLNELANWMPTWYERGSIMLAEINAGWPSGNLPTLVVDEAERV
jgi:hypothetical protein